MSAIAPPFTIRNARDDEYKTLGRLHATAFANDPMYNLFWSSVDPDVVLSWVWDERATAGVAKGDDIVLVIEHTNTNIIGLAWYKKYSWANQPRLPEQVPDGFNLSEYRKKEVPMQKWLRGLVEQYGEFLCTYGAFWQITPFVVLIVDIISKDVQEVAIAPAYQRKGVGAALMLRIIDLAKAQDLNIALAASYRMPRLMIHFRSHIPNHGCYGRYTSILYKTWVRAGSSTRYIGRWKGRGCECSFPP